MPNNDMKEIAKKYGIFFGLLFGMSAILISFILLAHGSWRHGLAQTVQDGLDMYLPDSYTVGEYHEIESTISTGAAVFSLKPKNANTAELTVYCVLIRVPTLTGLQPALYLYSQRNGVRFVGYAADLGKAEHVMNTDVGKSILSYWQRQVPVILEKAGVL